MVGVILLQHGKGADIGASFGGGSHTLFGARGAATFLSKFTVGCAIVFMSTSLLLAVAARNQASSSVIDDMGQTDDFFSGDVAPVAIPDAPAPADTTPPSGDGQ